MCHSCLRWMASIELTLNRCLPLQRQTNLIGLPLKPPKFASAQLAVPGTRPLWISAHPDPLCPGTAPAAVPAPQPAQAGTGGSPGIPRLPCSAEPSGERTGVTGGRGLVLRDFPGAPSGVLAGQAEPQARTPDHHRCGVLPPQYCASSGGCLSKLSLKSGESIPGSAKKTIEALKSPTFNHSV